MNRKTRFTLAVALVLGILGVRYFTDRAKEPAPAAAAPSAAVAARNEALAEQAAPAVTRRLGSLAFTPCTLAPEFGMQSVNAQCSTLEVPENRALPEGRKIRLAIAWIPAAREAAPDPVFMLSGGPGQSALESYPSIAGAFAEVNKARDVILVDQRGTGGSNKLVCEDSKGQSAVVEEEDYSLEAARAFAARCAATLSKTADLRFYSTSDAIQDLDAVRRAIGAEQINLMGISYGTRVAQQYARRYPAHTRTLTLDGIVPNSLVLGNDHARNLEKSLDMQFARCRQSKACVDKFGDPRTRLNALMQTLASDPPTVTYRDAITGESKQETMSPGHIATLARMFAYAPQVAGLLPLELHEAAQGRYEPLMALAKLLTRTIGGQIMHGMQLSVMCTEDAGEMIVDEADRGSLIGVNLITTLQAQCEAWPKGERPAGFREPLSGPVPVLVLSGEFDPVTPPHYGDQIAKTLPNARHLVVRGQGHNVLPVGCLPKLFAGFVASGDAKSLDAKCLDKVPYAQPFTGFYGWEP
nr:alpha/beta hydrolase [uncultured Pseudoxanthomonas sp.]